jgi:hypothetical protein
MPPLQAKVSHELDISEQALLKARQFLSSLQNDDVVASLNVKKYESVRDLIRHRLKDSLMEVYAQDYGDGMGANKGGTDGEQKTNDGACCGMSILLDLRDMEKNMMCVLQILTIISKPADVDEASLQTAADAYEETGLTMPRALAKKAWLNQLEAKFGKKEFESWASMCKVQPGGVKSVLSRL